MGFELIGLFAAILTAMQFIPQAIRTFRVKNLEGISRSTYILLVITASLWMMHGINVGDPYLVATNAFNFVVGCVVVWRTFAVGRKNT